MPEWLVTCSCGWARECSRSSAPKNPSLCAAGRRTSVMQDCPFQPSGGRQHYGCVHSGRAGCSPCVARAPWCTTGSTAPRAVRRLAPANRRRVSIPGVTPFGRPCSRSFVWRSLLICATRWRGQWSGPNRSCGRPPCSSSRRWWSRINTTPSEGPNEQARPGNNSEAVRSTWRFFGAGRLRLLLGPAPPTNRRDGREHPRLGIRQVLAKLTPPMGCCRKFHARKSSEKQETNGGLGRDWPADTRIFRPRPQFA